MHPMPLFIDVTRVKIPRRPDFYPGDPPVIMPRNDMYGEFIDHPLVERAVPRNGYANPNEKVILFGHGYFQFISFL
jgi:hypothetical protein